jgi:hypothetical protein
MSAPYPQLLSPDQIQVTPLNYEKYVDLENELSQEELVQFILQLRDKFVKDTKSKVGFNRFLDCFYQSPKVDSESILAHSFTLFLSE